VVLLADSVEAAARTLKEPSPAKIEELVHKIINNKFIDGQLDECDLTLKDLERIAEVFIRILTGIYHGRISYPETEQHS
jgi:membrane-associated HD superfamily phosphohydrolase